MSVGLFVGLLADVVQKEEEEDYGYEELGITAFILDAMAKKTILSVNNAMVTNNTQRIQKWMNRQDKNRQQFCDVIDSSNTFNKFQGTATTPPYVKAASIMYGLCLCRNITTRYRTFPPDPTCLIPGPTSLMNNFHYMVFTLDGTSGATGVNDYLMRVYDAPRNPTLGNFYMLNIRYYLGTAGGYFGLEARGNTTGQPHWRMSPNSSVVIGRTYILGFQWKCTQENMPKEQQEIVTIYKNPIDNSNVLSKNTGLIDSTRSSTRNLLVSVAGSDNGNANIKIHEIGSLGGPLTDDQILSFTDDLHFKWRVPNAKWQP